MEEPLRVRVVFDDRKMLSKSQRSEGLRRCWLLLEPGIATISDLESYVRRSFNLKRSCPHGLVFSMDDFVLPPFESTRVMKDKDIIRVRKKDATQSDDIELGDGPHYIQVSGVLEKQCTVSGDKLLAIREFGEDSGHKRKNDEHLCAHNDNAIHTGSPSKSKKKRKHSDEIQGSKKKKLKTSSKKPKVAGDEVVTVEDDEDNHLGNSLESSQKRASFLESPIMEDKPCTVNGGQGVASQLEGNVEKTGSVEREKRRKKSRLMSPEKAIIIAQGAQNIPTEQNQSSCQRDNSVECLHRKDKQSHKDGRSDVAFASQPDDNVIKKPSPVLMGKRNLHAAKNIGGNTCEPHENGSVTQVPSRSARRKKAKREWLREIKSQQREGQIPPNVIHGESPGQQQETQQNTEVEKEIIPVVIRPGHIRFQPLDEERIQGHSLETMETLQWNGTTSKKKGQKWGREKMVSNWDDANGYNEQSNGKERTMSKWSDANGNKGQKWGREKIARKWNDANGYKGHKWPREKTVTEGNDANHYSEQYYGKEKKTINKWNDANGSTEECNIMACKWDDANGYKEQSNKKALSEKGQTGSSLVDYESLFPLTRIPQVGDVLAYRLIELSSSWCPEVSSFRVGQVTSYNYLNMSIILVPVPEFPIFSDEDIERRESLLQSSPYNEDGSLQIHYPSLIDVRLLKATDLEATTSDYPGGEMTEEAAPVNNWERTAVNSNANHSEREMSTQEIAHVNNSELAVVNSNTKETVAQPADKGNASGSTWDQIKQALNEKKAALQKKKDGWDEWTPNKSSANTSWSYRGLRRSAVGPTLTYLRGRNDKYPHRK